MTPLESLQTEDPVVDLAAQGLNIALNELVRDAEAWQWWEPNGELPEWTTSRHEARAALEALRAAGWHLVRLEPGWLPGGVPAVAEEWTP